VAGGLVYVPLAPFYEAGSCQVKFG
jgi:hypothetical protein